MTLETKTSTIFIFPPNRFLLKTILKSIRLRDCKVRIFEKQSQDFQTWDKTLKAEIIHQGESSPAFVEGAEFREGLDPFSTETPTADESDETFFSTDDVKIVVDEKSEFDTASSVLDFEPNQPNEGMSLVTRCNNEPLDLADDEEDEVCEADDDDSDRNIWGNNWKQSKWSKSHRKERWK